MPDLSEAGQAIVSSTASRHHLPEEAVTHMLMALVNGRGTQAQFNIPALGGMGQWSRGGMTMVGDMFNSGLQQRVAALCDDLSGQMQGRDVFTAGPPGTQSQSQGHSAPQLDNGSSLFKPDPSRPAWPAELGQPSAQGAQNDLRYAVFPASRRLAIAQGGDIRVYDTGEHQIGGISQAQSAGQSLSFTSQYGIIYLSDLALVGGDAAVVQAPARPVPASAVPTDDDQVFQRIEKLAVLHEKGILTDVEFTTKKAELLDRL